MNLVDIADRTGARGRGTRASSGEDVAQSGAESSELLDALVDALLAGSRDAAERLVEQTYRQTYAALVRMCGDPDLAADLTQDTYRKAWTSLHTFRRTARFSTWLYRIAYNTFLNHVRRPKLMRPLEDAVQGGDDPRDDHESQEQALAGHQIDRELRRAVLALPDELRLVVTARFWGEVTVEEIARLEGVTGVAIRKRLRRAYQRLRADLDARSVATANPSAARETVS
jgi:RNA polymerase sigma-70 factor, ECF subfamily